MSIILIIFIVSTLFPHNTFGGVLLEKNEDSAKLETISLIKDDSGINEKIRNATLIQDQGSLSHAQCIRCSGRVSNLCLLEDA